jgi:uncharacterized protein YkwD
MQIPLLPPGKTAAAPLVPELRGEIRPPANPPESAPSRPRPTAPRSRGPLLLAAAGGAAAALFVATILGIVFLSQKSDPGGTAEATARPLGDATRAPADKGTGPSDARAKEPAVPVVRLADKETAPPDSPPEKLGPPAEKASEPAPPKIEVLPQKTPGESEPKTPQNKQNRQQREPDQDIPPPVVPKPSPPKEVKGKPLPVTPKPSPPEEKKGSTAEVKPAEVVMPTLGRTLEEIKKTLAEINVPPKDKLDALTADREAALRRLKSYRYLAGVPYQNLELDDELNRYASSSARISEKLGRLDHSPPNPGLPEEEYQVARKSASNCNLFFHPSASLSTSVDYYMYDSNPKNIVRLGHRRLCLSLPMKKVGFGRAGGYSAMWHADRSQQAVPALDFIAFPPPGLMPVEFFHGDYAWSISLIPEKYARPDDSVEVSVYPTDPSGEKIGTGVSLNNVCVNRVSRAGINNCIIFRPETSAVGAGNRFLVEIKGIRYTNGKPSPPLRYPVIFVRLDIPTIAQATTPEAVIIQTTKPTAPAIVQPTQKAYAFILNQTEGPIHFLLNKGDKPYRLEALKTLNLTTPLPAQGFTIHLLPPDPAGKPIPITVRNGDRFTVHQDGKGYRVERAPPPAKEKGPSERADAANNDMEAGRQAIVKLVNDYRASKGLKRLKVNSQLAAIAQKYADEMATKDKFGDPGSEGHVMDGKDTLWRARQGGYKAGVLENLAYYPKDPPVAEVPSLFLKTWQRSPAHDKTMRDDRATETGVGLARSKTGTWYTCQLFSIPFFDKGQGGAVVTNRTAAVVKVTYKGSPNTFSIPVGTSMGLVVLAKEGSAVVRFIPPQGDALEITVRHGERYTITPKGEGIKLEKEP